MLDIEGGVVTQEEIVENIIQLLRAHKEGLLGSIHQDPYTRNFFVQFRDAYNAGMTLYADALRDIIVARAPELAEGETWDTLYRFWSDWTYAWDHASERA